MLRRHCHVQQGRASARVRTQSSLSFFSSRIFGGFERALVDGTNPRHRPLLDGIARCRESVRSDAKTRNRELKSTGMSRLAAYELAVCSHGGNRCYLAASIVVIFFLQVGNIISIITRAGRATLRIVAETPLLDDMIVTAVHHIGPLTFCSHSVVGIRPYWIVTTVSGVQSSAEALMSASQALVCMLLVVTSLSPILRLNMSLLALHLWRWEIASPSKVSALGQGHSIGVHSSVLRALSVMAVKWAVIFSGPIVIVIRRLT